MHVKFKSICWFQCFFMTKVYTFVNVHVDVGCVRLSKVRGDDGHAPLVEAVVFAWPLSLCVKVQGEQQVGARGIQVNRESHFSCHNFVCIGSVN